MKFSLIAAVVLLAVAQASFAQDAANIDIVHMIEEFKNKMSHQITEVISNQDLANQAQNIKTQLEPLAAQVQEQVKAAMAQMEEQVKPLASEAQAQLGPIVEKFQKQMEDYLQTLMDQARALGN
ncbi:type-4 ice-structuring protein-like [Solea solea]|uniref:type-4 ice-structuring protein-like n=1 Tax=Solea solea TaxID=90069 RepID=UPI00272D70D5|nr:type-4 ice-structuring protein-like [Solea solea]